MATLFACPPRIHVRADGLTLRLVIPARAALLTVACCISLPLLMCLRADWMPHLDVPLQSHQWLALGAGLLAYLAVVLAVTWPFLGVEELDLTEERLTVCYRLLGFGVRRSYPVADLSGWKIVPHPWLTSATLKMTDSTPVILTFSEGVRTVSLRGCLDYEEASLLLPIILHKLAHPEAVPALAATHWDSGLVIEQEPRQMRVTLPPMRGWYSGLACSFWAVAWVVVETLTTRAWLADPSRVPTAGLLLATVLGAVLLLTVVRTLQGNETIEVGQGVMSIRRSLWGLAYGSSYPVDEIGPLRAAGRVLLFDWHGGTIRLAHRLNRSDLQTLLRTLQDAVDAQRV